MLSGAGHWLSVLCRHWSTTTVPLLFTRIEGALPGGRLASRVLSVTNCPFGKASRRTCAALVALLSAEEQKGDTDHNHLLKQCCETCKVEMRMPCVLISSNLFIRHRFSTLLVKCELLPNDEKALVERN